MLTDNRNEFERWLDGIFSDATPKSHTITIKHQNLNTTPSFEIRNILSNRKKLAFTVVWADGTTTTVHLQPGDEWDDEKALAMCFTKKALGNKGNFNDKFNDALNNKMKIIPGGAGIVAEKECDCDNTCTECKCKEESEVDKALAKEFVKKSLEKTNAFGLSKETADKLAKATVKADNSLKEMIDALTGETIKIQRYNLLLVEPNGFEREIYHQGTDGEIHKAMRTYRMKHYPILEANGTPYRVWQRDGSLFVDFGAGSYFKVPGMEHDTFVKGK